MQRITDNCKDKNNVKYITEGKTAGCDAVEKIMKKAFKIFELFVAAVTVTMLIVITILFVMAFSSSSMEKKNIENAEILKIEACLYGNNTSNGAGGMVGIFRKGDTIYAERIRAAEIVIKSDGPTEIVVNQVNGTRKIYITEKDLRLLLGIPE